MVRFAFATLVCVMSGAPGVPTGAQDVHPPSIALDGTTPLALVAHATRAHLLGARDLYSLGLYLEGVAAEREKLASPASAKAIRIRVLHRDEPGDRPTIDWRRELVPALEPAATTHLRAAFTPLRHDDVVLIEYLPGRGTTVHVNKAAAVPKAGHELMLAFLDHWLGQRPVSEEMKETLLRRE